jgi:hypothetical protein
MRIETTEHGRRIVIDIDREGVRIRVFSTDGSAQDYQIPPATHPGPVIAYGGGGGVGPGALGGQGGIAYGGGWQPDDNCPICLQRHNPKEHAGGAGSPAAADERAARAEA